MNQKKFELIHTKDKNIIILYYKGNKRETKLKLKKLKFNKDEIFSNLLNEFNSLKKKLNSKNNEKSNDEYKKILEEKIFQKNEEIKKLKEKLVLLEAQQEQYIKEMHKEKKDIFDERKTSEQLNNENKMEIRQEINELNDNNNNYNEDKNKINDIKELSNKKILY